MASIAAFVAEVREAFARRPVELVALLVAAVLVIASYGFARPAVESLFVERYGSARLPWAWLGVGVGAVAVTAAYNRFVASMSLVRLWPRAIASCVAIGGFLFAALALDVPHAEFALYLWKDIYIVVVVELFWSVANVSFPLKRASWLYGAFLAAGSLGGLCAELTVGHLATAVGSVGAAAVSLPLLVLAAALAPLLPRAAAGATRSPARALVEVARRGARILRQSRYLLLLVGLVALVQISITVLDYQFNVALEAHVPDVDARTGLAGRIYATISAASLVLQLLSGLIIRGLGIPVVIALSPLLLLAGSLAFALHPRFGLIAVVKVASKVLDYSLGRAAKELLYIPLSYDEKTEGKALVDLLSYRVAKALASALLLWLIAAQLGGAIISAMVIALLVGWLVMAVLIGRRFEATTEGAGGAAGGAEGGGAEGAGV